MVETYSGTIWEFITFQVKMPWTDYIFFFLGWGVVIGLILALLAMCTPVFWEGALGMRYCPKCKRKVAPLSDGTCAVHYSIKLSTKTDKGEG